MDGRYLLDLLKSTTFGKIPFDDLIFNMLHVSSSSTETDDTPLKKQKPPDDLIFGQLTKSLATRQPINIILCGAPGCGKSTIKQQLLSLYGVTEYIDIDPDEIRNKLIDLKVTFPNRDNMSRVINEYNKRISNKAQQDNFNIVFDTTGRNFNAVKDLIKVSTDNGYKTCIVIVWASSDTCRLRVLDRFTKYPDRVSPSVAAAMYTDFEKGSASRLLLSPQVSPTETLLLDNNIAGKPAQLIYYKKSDVVIYATNFPNFYDMTINNHEPYIQKTSDIPTTGKAGGGKRKKTRKKTRKHKSKSKKRSKYR
jgi:predicted kinase